MKGISIYQPPGCPAQTADFVDGLEPKLRKKLLWQIFRLTQIPRSDWKEPHYKHFTLERYRSFYEVREKGKIIVRVIFTVRPSGEILLLNAFIQKQSRDTMQALEQSLRILSELREHPEYAVEYKIKEEHT